MTVGVWDWSWRDGLGESGGRSRDGDSMAEVGVDFEAVTSASEDVSS
jgi:hypothetical protein